VGHHMAKLGPVDKEQLSFLSFFLSFLSFFLIELRG
jgi:hypothetical protein